MRFSRLFGLCLVLTLLVSVPAEAQRFVCMESTQGNWCAELQWKAAPNSVANFLQYVNGGYYSNTLIHRSVPGFIEQGGGFSVSAANVIGALTTFAPVALEYSLPNVRGTMAMARTSDLNSATSQWFVNLVDNTTTLGPANGGGYAVFADVVQGMDVFDKIAALGVYDASSLLGYGTTFTTLPLTTSTLARSSLVLVTRAYATDLLPGTTAAQYHCSTPATNDTLTELCSGAATFPVYAIGLGYYEVTLQLTSSSPQVILAIKAGSLKPLGSVPTSYAIYDPATKVLTLPSVRISQNVYTGLTFNTSDTQNFTLQSFSH
ncbi:MAG TPA: peptidylprolyl isomerase [Candidatus Acidoferrum sp.]|nr:peptidylprolyl isomerase [Candidatus Acidoferrum sp.]